MTEMGTYILDVWDASYTNENYTKAKLFLHFNGFLEMIWLKEIIIKTIQ